MWQWMITFSFAGSGALIFNGFKEDAGWQLGLGIAIMIVSQIYWRSNERPFVAEGRSWTKKAKGQTRIHPDGNRSSLWYNKERPKK